MSSKRKAPVMADGDGPDAKRLKLPTSEKETSDSTTEVGFAFLAQLKQSRDKRARLIATNFLTLPDREQTPEYYEAVRLPIALDTIEAKLSRREYPTVTTLESDLKRMISNAKSYNERTSEIFSDAEKVRKMVTNYMTKHNPAYRDGSGYTPFPTPVPGDERNGVQKPEKQKAKQDPDRSANVDRVSDHGEAVERPRRVTIHGPSAPNHHRASSTPAVQDAKGAGESFDGNSFQEAQEKILTELINLKNDNQELISGPFVNLPSRELRDYYRLIKHPVCLKSVQKLVLGIKGRDKPTGISFFKSWQAFEDEVNYIWTNARTYNEDGSEIFELAGELQACFDRRLAEAKAVVTEPSQPKVKLRMSAKSPDPAPKITLRFGQKTPSDNPTGVTVDSEALKRQQDLVKAGANGQGEVSIADSVHRPGARNPFGGSNSGSSSTPIPTLDSVSRGRQPSASATSPPAAVNGIKHETKPGQSPALAAVQPTVDSAASNEANSIMPPPSVTPRLPSGSPHPQATTNSHLPHVNNPNNPLDMRWRQPGKDASDALITNLNIATHPGLKIDRHFNLDIPPSPTASQQSVTISLPSTHYCLRITPTVAPSLTYRQSKLFVSLNSQRLNPSSQKADEVDVRRPLYETRVMPGVNRIEVEMIAGPPRGVPKIGSGPEIELEKITIFASVLRA